MVSKPSAASAVSFKPTVLRDNLAGRSGEHAVDITHKSRCILKKAVRCFSVAAVSKACVRERKMCGCLATQTAHPGITPIFSFLLMASNLSKQAAVEFTLCCERLGSIA